MGATLLDVDATPLPWLWEAAARFAGEDPDQLRDDAGAITRSLSHVADLFGLPAICTSFDTVREAEALGCDIDAGEVQGFVSTADEAFDIDLAAMMDSERVRVGLDACERLASTFDEGVLGGITGPVTLTKQLAAEPISDLDEATVEELLFTATDVCVDLVNAHFDHGADGIAMLEPDGVDIHGYSEVATSIANVLDHYETVGVVVTERVDLTDIEAVGELGIDVVTGGVDEPQAALTAADRAGVTLGVGIPANVFLDGPDAVDGFVADLPADTLVSSAWTVPSTVEPESLHQLMGSL